MIKVGNRMVGEDPDEQLKLERKRFEQKQTSKSSDHQLTNQELLKRGEGNQQLSEF